MIKQLKKSSRKVLEDYSDSIQYADNLKDLLEVKEKIDSNPIWPKDLGVDNNMAELDIVTETITKLNKKITEKLDAKGKQFWKQELSRLQQFPNEEERKVMQEQHFQRTKDAFVDKKARSFEDLEKWVINNYFDVQKKYQSIKEGVKKYISIKVDKLIKYFEKLDEIEAEIVETYESKVLSKLRSNKIENIQDLPKNYILNSIGKVKNRIYHKTKSFYFDDPDNDEDLIDSNISTYEQTIKQSSDNLAQEILHKIYDKLYEKVFQIREEFKCQSLLQEIKTQTLRSMSDQANLSNVLLNLIKDEEKYKAEILLLKIENFMEITIPKLNSTKIECLINRDAVGYDQLKDQFKTSLFTQMDIVMNHIKEQKLQEANNKEESKVLIELNKLQVMNAIIDSKISKIFEEITELKKSRMR